MPLDILGRPSPQTPQGIPTPQGVQDFPSNIVQYTALGTAAGAGIGAGLNMVAPETFNRGAVPMGAVIGGIAGLGKGLNADSNQQSFIPNAQNYRDATDLADELPRELPGADPREAVKIAAIVGSALASRIVKAPKPAASIKPLAQKAPAVQASAKEPGLGTTTLQANNHPSVGKPSGGSGTRPG